MENDFDPASWKPWFQVSLFGGSCKGRVLLLGWLLPVSEAMSQSMSSISLFESRSNMFRGCGLGLESGCLDIGETGGVTIIVLSDLVVPSSVFCSR